MGKSVKLGDIISLVGNNYIAVNGDDCSKCDLSTSSGSCKVDVLDDLGIACYNTVFNKLDEMIILESDICNEDICPYYEECLNGSNRCIINIISKNARNK